MFTSSRTKKPAEPDPLRDVQHGGDHYKSMGIQPVEFCYANGYDNCAFSVLKYVSRHRRKAGALDLDKAIHFIDLRSQMVDMHGECKATTEIGIARYLGTNNIPHEEGRILTMLHSWVIGIVNDPAETALTLKGLINDLKVQLYGDNNA